MSKLQKVLTIGGPSLFFVSELLKSSTGLVTMATFLISEGLNVYILFIVLPIIKDVGIPFVSLFRTRLLILAINGLRPLGPGSFIPRETGTFALLDRLIS